MINSSIKAKLPRPQEAPVIVGTFVPGRYIRSFSIFRDGNDHLLIEVHEKEQVESPAPEPAQKQSLDDPHGEPFFPDRRVVAPAPLPDALPEKVKVVEGVGGEAKVETAKHVKTFPFSSSVSVKWTARYGKISAEGRTELEALQALDLKLNIQLYYLPE